MPKNSAEYMRAYRARKRQETIEAPGKILTQLAEDIPGGRPEVAELIAERDRLREEVHQLKLQLARRPPAYDSPYPGPDTRPRLGDSFGRSYPAPKLGKK